MSDDIKYEERLVAFIDILGFKELVKKSENDTSKIVLINNALNYLKNWEIPQNWGLKYIEIEEDAQKRGVDSFDIRNKTNSTSFSDSIVVSVKVNNNVNEMATTLIANLAYIGAFLLEEGILFRGGLTIGNLVHNENGTVFGQGLIDAYKLESNNAKYPRIILSDKLISRLIYPLITKKNRYPYHQYIVRFDDGCVGFHQMQYYQVMQTWEGMTINKLKKYLEKIRLKIIGGLDASFENPSIYEKYVWLKKEYNKLIILKVFDKNGESKDNIKMKIRNLNEGLVGTNIHFSYTDNFWNES